MGYDEKIFKTKANIKARGLWLVFSILLTANYGTDTANGAYSVSNYIIFVILCWLPFVCGDILLKKKGKDNDRYRLAFVIGYGIFYVFLLCTTTSLIVSNILFLIIALLPNLSMKNTASYTQAAGTVLSDTAGRSLPAPKHPSVQTLLLLCHLRALFRAP